MRVLTRSLVLTLTVAVLAGVGSLAALAAPASAAATLQRSDYLRFPSDPSFLRVNNRRIYLAAGCYTWRAFSQYWADRTPEDDARRICLRRGWYRWHIRIVEHEDDRGHCCPPVRDYLVESRLYELATGGRPAVVRYHLHRIGAADGSYTWGSTLQHR